MSQTDFTEGIVAGVPQGTLVSHKFGVRTVASHELTPDSQMVSNHELHDCGIVYYPNNPYFICVMTQGKEFNSLQSVIQGASELVWKYVAETHGQEI